MTSESSFSIKDYKGVPTDKKLDALFMKTDGFFVDVGAHDGLTQSNTAFFEKHRNWKGICIEPSIGAFIDCVKNRPNSKVINCACVSSDFGKSIAKGDFDSHLMSSIDGKRLNRDTLVSVPARPLDRILESQKVTTIDLLNIDVSGYEKEMITGLSLSKIRPKYILIEILKPNLEDVLKYFADAKYNLLFNVTNFGPPHTDNSAHNDYLFVDAGV